MSDTSEPVVQCDWCGKLVPDDTSVVYHEDQVYCTDCGTHLNITQNRNNDTSGFTCGDGGIQRN